MRTWEKILRPFLYRKVFNGILLEKVKEGKMMLTDEMKSMAYLINKEILKIFPYEYIKEVCSGEITMKEIIDQIMMECCKYAYDNSLETHSLDYYMGGATKANDSDRMMYQRVLDYVRNKREIEQIELGKIGINKYDDQIKYRYNIMDKISGHELNKFHFWELQNIHDMHLVKAIVDKRIGKGNFTLDKMQEYSDEYDCFVDSIKKDWYGEHKNSLFDYLAFFTLEWKYSFDFYYEIADALSYMKRRNIKNMRNWIALFSVPLVMYSDLLLSHPGVVPGRVTSNNRMLTARRKYIKYIVISDSLDYEAVKKQFMGANVIICTILERVTIGGKSLQHWFWENTVEQDWLSVMEEYNAFQAFVSNKKWDKKKLRIVKDIYNEISFDYKNHEIRS